MKKALIVPVMTALLATTLLTGCVPGGGGDYDALQADYEALRAELTASQNRLSTMETAVTSLRETINQTTLSNPTWDELVGFLTLDDTDAFEYDKDKFDCTGFAITLRDRAWRAGLRCAYVEIAFSDKAIGHALNAFETSDRGIVYIDGQDDSIAYLKMGKLYGTITLDTALESYIDIPGSPAAFWQPLAYTTSSDIYSYGYYTGYLARYQFYSDSVNAYNQTVDRYNSGDSSVNTKLLQGWGDNLNALSAEFGETFYEPMGKVEQIQIYWN